MCRGERQLRQFERIYRALGNANGDKIEPMTGCKKPCHYKEYNFVGSSPKVLVNPSVLGFWAASHTTQVEMLEKFPFPG